MLWVAMPGYRKRKITLSDKKRDIDKKFILK